MTCLIESLDDVNWNNVAGLSHGFARDLKLIVRVGWFAKETLATHTCTAVVGAKYTAELDLGSIPPVTCGDHPYPLYPEFPV